MAASDSTLASKPYCNECKTDMFLKEPIGPADCKPKANLEKPNVYGEVLLTYECPVCQDEEHVLLDVPLITMRHLRNALKEVARALRQTYAPDGSTLFFDDQVGCYVLLHPFYKMEFPHLAHYYDQNMIQSLAMLQDMGALRIRREDPISLEIYVLGFILAMHLP